MFALSQNTSLSESRLGEWIYTGSEHSQQLDSKLSGQSNLCACTVFMDIILLPHFGWHFWKCFCLPTSMYEASHVLIHEMCIMKYWLNRVEGCRKKIDTGHVPTMLHFDLNSESCTRLWKNISGGNSESTINSAI